MDGSAHGLSIKLRTSLKRISDNLIQHVSTINTSHDCLNTANNITAKLTNQFSARLISDKQLLGSDDDVFFGGQIISSHLTPVNSRNHFQKVQLTVNLKIIIMNLFQLVCC